MHPASDTDGHSMAAESDFCSGMFMTMAMKGFQFSLGQKQQEKPDCLTYFVSPWQLDSAEAFRGAMFYTFLLGVMTECLFSLTPKLRAALPPGKLRRVLMGLLYGLQQWLGYSLMLLTMMFSVEIFASVLLGIMVGTVLFKRDAKPEDDDDAEDTPEFRSYRHGDGGDAQGELQEFSDSSTNSGSADEGQDSRPSGPLGGNDDDDDDDDDDDESAPSTSGSGTMRRRR